MFFRQLLYLPFYVFNISCVNFIFIYFSTFFEAIQLLIISLLFVPARESMHGMPNGNHPEPNNRKPPNFTRYPKTGPLVSCGVNILRGQDTSKRSRNRGEISERNLSFLETFSWLEGGERGDSRVLADLAVDERHCQDVEKEGRRRPHPALHSILRASWQEGKRGRAHIRHQISQRWWFRGRSLFLVSEINQEAPLFSR